MEAELIAVDTELQRWEGEGVPDAPTWQRQLIAVGLRALLSLRMERQPARDTVRATAEVWLAALDDEMTDFGLDALRVRDGFLELAAFRSRWPQPIHLRQAMRSRWAQPIRETTLKMIEARVAKRQKAAADARAQLASLPAIIFAGEATVPGKAGQLAHIARCKRIVAGEGA